MHVLLTGGTGFLGRHMAEALTVAGHQVRALCRSDDKDLASRGCQVFRGDVLDAESVQKAMVGIDAVVHAAGVVSRDAKDRGLMMRVHIVGAQNIARAAREEGVGRIVHISTSGTLAVSPNSDMVRHEDDGVPLQLISRWSYYMSKWLAERAMLSDARSGTGEKSPDVIILNPTLTLGPGDLRGSSTVEVRRFLQRQVPVVPDGGLSFVDVRDVAEAAVAALTKGDDGERYLLGAINLTFQDFFHRLTEISGVAGPRLNIPVPKALSRFGVALIERAAHAVGATPVVSAVEADMASHYWYCDSRKAEDALGFTARDPMKTLIDTVRDIRGEGTGTTRAA